MENFDRRMLLAGLGLVGAAAAASAGAGTLNPPPGPVAPTGKTTDEIEPRVAVQSLAGDVFSVHLITQPGSYYLLGNINGRPGRAAVAIAAGNVTLDLCGFALIGVAGSFAGIELRDSTQIVVRNGSIRTFDQSGISTFGTLTRHVRIEGIGISNIVSGAGISVDGSHVRDCELTSIGGPGIFVSTTSGLVERCVVSGCSSSGIVAKTVTSCTVFNVVSTAGSAAGILASIVSDCSVDTVSGSTSSTGISQAQAATGCTIRNVGLTTSTASTIGAHANSAFGLDVRDIRGAGPVAGILGNTVSNCNVVNLVQGASTATMTGIVADVITACRVDTITGLSTTPTSGILDARVVRDCAVSSISNTGPGFAFGLNKTNNNAGSIENCVFQSCGDVAVSVGARQRIVGCTIEIAITGILANNVRNVIDGNTIDSCTTGISVTSGTNTANALVVRNQVRNCTNNFVLDTPCQFGPTVSATGQIASTNPWANFTD